MKRTSNAEYQDAEENQQTHPETSELSGNRTLAHFVHRVFFRFLKSGKLRLMDVPEASDRLSSMSPKPSGPLMQKIFWRYAELSGETKGDSQSKTLLLTSVHPLSNTLKLDSGPEGYPLANRTFQGSVPSHSSLPSGQSWGGFEEGHPNGTESSIIMSHSHKRAQDCGLLDSPFSGVKQNVEQAKALGSSDSEDEPLPFLQDILTAARDCPADTMGDLSSGMTGSSLLSASRGATFSFKNTLEQMVKERKQKERKKETERDLLQVCKEDLLKLAECEEDEEEVHILQKQSLCMTLDSYVWHPYMLNRNFLQRFSVQFITIPNMAPGEEVFLPGTSGQLFNQDTLDLRQCNAIPHNISQETLLSASPAQQILHIRMGSVLRAYCLSPCQPDVSRWFFQMMSIHSDRQVSTQILHSMEAIALIAAKETVNQKGAFKVWTPSVLDVALVIHNMGVSFTTLFPEGILQPPFSERTFIHRFPQTPDTHRLENSALPEHNIQNVIKYLSLCTALCPRAYSDQELLQLLTMSGRLSLESRLQMIPAEELYQLVHNLIHNMKEWDTQLPHICLILSNLNAHHHNLRRLLDLLPHSQRGRQLRQQFSMSVISKILDGHCTYRPTCGEFQLAVLRHYLPRMRPSFLLKSILGGGKEHSLESLDYQAYYTCYSLLVFTSEATKFESLLSNQKKELSLLCAQMEEHIKSDVRETKKWLYRSQVMELVARIYTRWHLLLYKSKHLEGRPYSYCPPLSEGTATETEEQEEAL